MLKATVTPTQSEIAIRIPKEYINHEVEILVLPLFEMQAPPKSGNDEPDKALAKLFKNAPNVKVEAPKDIDALMNEVNDVVL